jgi:hypothetical protein
MKNNFDDALHIVRKINYFFGMCLEDIDHLKYDEALKALLKTAVHAHGDLFLKQMLTSIKLIEKASHLGMIADDWDPTDDLLKNVQSEFDARFGNVNKKKFQAGDPFSERQENKKDDEKTPQGPRDNKGPQGGIPRA